MKKMNKKGFTLVELLAVIVILGLLMAIAIPSVTKYITQSRKKTLISSIDSYITGVTTAVNDNEFGALSNQDVCYYIPVSNDKTASCVTLENPSFTCPPTFCVSESFDLNSGNSFSKLRNSTINISYSKSDISGLSSS